VHHVDGGGTAAALPVAEAVYQREGLTYSAFFSSPERLAGGFAQKQEH